MNEQTRIAHSKCVTQSKSSKKYRRNYLKKRKREKCNEQDELGAGLEMPRCRKPVGTYDAKAPTTFQRDIFLLGPHSWFHKKIGVSNVCASPSNFQFKSIGQYRQIPTCSLLITPQEAQTEVAVVEPVILTQDEEGEKVVAEV